MQVIQPSTYSQVKNLTGDVVEGRTTVYIGTWLIVSIHIATMNSGKTLRPPAVFDSYKVTFVNDKGLRVQNVLQLFIVAM